MTSDYYVYGYFEPGSDKPFYIGKGRKGRALGATCTCLKRRSGAATFTSTPGAGRQGGTPDVRLLHESLTDSDAEGHGDHPHRTMGPDRHRHGLSLQPHARWRGVLREKDLRRDAGKDKPGEKKRLRRDTCKDKSGKHGEEALCWGERKAEPSEQREKALCQGVGKAIQAR